MSLIAREYDVNANMVFRWRQQYQDGAFGPVSQSATLLPVEVIETHIDLPPTVPLAQESHSETFIAVVGRRRFMRVLPAPGTSSLRLAASN